MGEITGEQKYTTLFSGGGGHNGASHTNRVCVSGESSISCGIVAARKRRSFDITTSRRMEDAAFWL